MKLKLNLKDNVSRYILIDYAIWGVVLLCIILAGFFISQILTVRQEIEFTQQEYLDVQSEVSYVNLAKLISQDSVEEFNEILIGLIPEEEDYFSLIRSLEQLSSRTGLRIEKYGLTLPDNATERFSLTISGQIPREDFDRFLDIYKYGSGRLVTITNISYTDRGLIGLSLTINLYSKKVTTSNILRVGSLDQDDIDTMQAIADNVREAQSIGLEIEEEMIASEGGSLLPGTN